VKPVPSQEYGIFPDAPPTCIIEVDLEVNLEAKRRMQLILYSKPGCHLCEGLYEKLEQVRQVPIDIEVRDITTRPDWFQAYQYKIPVLFWLRSGADPASNSKTSGAALIPLPRLSPRASVQRLEQMLQKFWAENRQE
jgi:hypothetical protein